MSVTKQSTCAFGKFHFVLSTREESSGETSIDANVIFESTGSRLASHRFDQERRIAYVVEDSEGFSARIRRRINSSGCSIVDIRIARGFRSKSEAIQAAKNFIATDPQLNVQLGDRFPRYKFFN